MSNSKKTQTFSTQQVKTTSSPQPIQNIPQQRPAGSTSPSHQDITNRAKEIYFQKGCPQGQDEQIWLQAEKELRSKKMAVSSSK
jgi:hypothetical protein